MDRTTFFPKKVSYLCSFDFDSNRQAWDRKGGSRGSQVLVFDKNYANEHPAPVYNALGQEFVLGEPAIRGWIQVLQLQVSYPDEEYGDLHGRLTAVTDDNAVLEATYQGVFPAGPRHWGVVSASPDPSQAAGSDKPQQTRACLSLRFDMTNTKYRWLVQYQCVAYGRLWLADGVPVSGTFDIHAMTVPNDVREAVAATG
jgi:Protein of unknown function (DUF3237)